MVRGKFISIEGTEGAGKSTALTFIQSWLVKSGIDVIWTREPGGTALGEEIRRVLLHPESNDIMMPETELLLMFAARAQHLQTVIKPTLEAGKWVVSDRFIDASYAYQCGGRGVDEKYVKQLDSWIVNACYPDVTLLLDIELEKGFERASQRGAGHDRIEREKMDFFARVRDTYLKRARNDPARIKIIDANASLSDVEKQIQRVLGEMIM